jgi:Leucine-rich repeat (LRR) protein
VGNVPNSLENLVQLSDLDISNNQLTGPIPLRLVNLPQLTQVDLSYNLLSGEMHFGLMNETQLTDLYLSNNRLTGPVTFGLMNPKTQLRVLDLSTNKLHGQISNSIFNLKNLEFLDLSDNHLNGILKFDKFVKLTQLTALHISGYQLSLLTKETSANATLQSFQALGFSSCNLTEFPNFLRNQFELRFLNLSNNKIHGQVPKWIWTLSEPQFESTPVLQVLDLSNNFLTSFDQHPTFLPGDLTILDLRSNLFQGSLPIPPSSILHFYISNNLLSGNISELLCKLHHLEVLDLANNNLSGSLPRCLDNFGALSILDPRRNKF